MIGGSTEKESTKKLKITLGSKNVCHFVSFVLSQISLTLRPLSDKCTIKTFSMVDLTKVI